MRATPWELHAFRLKCPPKLDTTLTVHMRRRTLEEKLEAIRLVEEGNSHRSVSDRLHKGYKQHRNELGTYPQTLSSSWAKICVLQLMKPRDLLLVTCIIVSDSICFIVNYLKKFPKLGKYFTTDKKRESFQQKRKLFHNLWKDLSLSINCLKTKVEWRLISLR